MAAKANATLYFLDGKTLDVTETLAQILLAIGDGTNIRYGITLTKPNGDKAWVSPIQFCRIEPA
jgi:hypothetical protein